MLRDELDRLTDDPDVDCHPKLLAELSEHHSHNIRIIEWATHTQMYTCFMHAFGLREQPEYIRVATSGSGKIFANSLFVSFLLQRGYLQERTAGTVCPDGVVIYFAAGVPQHAGITKGKERIESKWGSGHLYEHGALEVPAKYGDEVKYYSSISKDMALKHFLEYANDNLQTGGAG